MMGGAGPSSVPRSVKESPLTASGDSEMNRTVTRPGSRHLERAYANCVPFWEMDSSTHRLAEFLEDDSHVLVVPELDGKPVGQVLGYVLTRWDARSPKLFLYSVDVADGHRRVGIGRRLIEEFIETGQELGCGSAFAPTSEHNVAAVRLYEATGTRRATDAGAVTFEWETHP